MVIISMMDNNDFVTSAILGTETYGLHFSWNSEGFWLMDLRTDIGQDILRGIKVVPNFPLLNQYRRGHPRRHKKDFAAPLSNYRITISKNSAGGRGLWL